MEDYIDLSSTGVDRGVFVRGERSSIVRAKQIKGSREIHVVTLLEIFGSRKQTIDVDGAISIGELSQLEDPFECFGQVEGDDRDKMPRTRERGKEKETERRGEKDIYIYI